MFGPYFGNGAQALYRTAITTGKRAAALQKCRGMKRKTRKQRRKRRRCFARARQLPV